MDAHGCGLQLHPFDPEQKTRAWGSYAPWTAAEMAPCMATWTPQLWAHATWPKLGCFDPSLEPQAGLMPYYKMMSATQLLLSATRRCMLSYTLSPCPWHPTEVSSRERAYLEAPFGMRTPLMMANKCLEGRAPKFAAVCMLSDPFMSDLHACRHAHVSTDLHASWRMPSPA